MLRLAADENFDGRIVRGLLRVLPDLDLVRVQDSDEPIGRTIDDLRLIVVVCPSAEIEGQVLFLPLR